MSGGIFLIQGNGELVAMTEETYDSEDILQGLLAKYPDLLAGNQMDTADPRRWLLVAREHGVPGTEGGPDRWAVDHLFLDQDGVPTFVEVKRSTNTQIRREVVGQMLDYAANAVVYWPVEAIRAGFETACEKRSEDPGAVLMQALGEGLDIESFWGNVKTNLQAGKVRLVFVADKIPLELRRVVEFLNSQMDPAEVLALEVPQYVGGSLKSLVPRLIGRTAEAEQKKSGSGGARRKWDEASFLAECGPEDAEVARRILGWTRKTMSDVSWGTGAVYGSFIPVILDQRGIGHTLIAVWTNGAVEVQFGYMQGKPPFDDEGRRRKLRELLVQIPGVTIPPEAVSGKWPSFPLAVLRDDSAFRQFVEALDWAIEEIRAL